MDASSTTTSMDRHVTLETNRVVQHCTQYTPTRKSAQLEDDSSCSWIHQNAAMPLLRPAIKQKTHFELASIEAYIARIARDSSRQQQQQQRQQRANGSNRSAGSAIQERQSTPDRVLDAPGVVNDYYLNVFDWSVRNMIAVALGSSVYLWNGADGGAVRELCSFTNEASTNQNVSSVRWMHDGRSLAVGASDGTIQIWDCMNLRRIRTMVSSPSSVFTERGQSQQRIGSMAWNRHLLANGTRSGAVEIHDVRVARHLTQTLSCAGGAASNVHSTSTNTPMHAEVCGLQWNTDTQRLAVGYNDNSLRVFDAAHWTADPMNLVGHSAAVKALAWCPFRRGLLASGGGSSDRSIRTWDTTTIALTHRQSDGGTECIESLTLGAQVSALHWAHSSSSLHELYASNGNDISVCSTNAIGRQLSATARIGNAHDARILGLVCNPVDPRQYASISADESIKFWTLSKRIASKKGRRKHMSRDANAAASGAAAEGHSNSKLPSAPSPFSLRQRAFR